MPKQLSYGAYGDAFRAFGTASLCIEVQRTVRQRGVLISASMVLPQASVPTTEQKNGYCRVLVYVGALSANLDDRANIQASRADWTSLGAERILLNHVFPINDGFSLVLPLEDGETFGARESQVLGALLVSPCDQLGVVMDGVGSLTFYGASSDVADKIPYKVV